MKRDDLYNLIDSFAGDVQLRYDGDDIFIDPLIRDKQIILGYKGVDKNYQSVVALMADPIFKGKPLNDICQDVELL